MKLHLLSVRLAKEAPVQLPFLFKRCVIFVHPECKYSADRTLIDMTLFLLFMVALTVKSNGLAGNNMLINQQMQVAFCALPSPLGPTLKKCKHTFLVTNDFILHSCLARRFSSLASDRK